VTASIRRAFLAVVPPSAVLDAVERMVGSHRVENDGLRWTTRQQWHITVQFLGVVADVGAVTQAVRDTCAACDSFEAQLVGAGAFPSARRAAVLWLGMREGSEPLSSLAAAISACLSQVGYIDEERSFHPHLTLARMKPARRVDALVDGLGDGPVGSTWLVADVVLFERRTATTGAEYREVARFALGE